MINGFKKGDAGRNRTYICIQKSKKRANLLFKNQAADKPQSRTLYIYYIYILMQKSGCYILRIYFLVHSVSCEVHSSARLHKLYMYIYRYIHTSNKIYMVFMFALRFLLLFPMSFIPLKFPYYGEKYIWPRRSSIFLRSIVPRESLLFV